MATLCKFGPAPSAGILLPHKTWLEPDWLYEHRCNLVKDGKQGEEVLQNAFQELLQLGLINDASLPK